MPDRLPWAPPDPDPDVACVHCGCDIELHDNSVPECLRCTCNRVVFDDGPFGKDAAEVDF